MSGESLTFSNDSIPRPPPSLITTSLPFGLSCLVITPGSWVFATFTVTVLILVLPLCILVLYFGLQQWRQPRSSSGAAKSCHSDSFSYHLVTMETCSVFGSILCCYGIYSCCFAMLFVWYYLYCFAWFGKTFFHILTCVEHYLAVVHPVTYLSLRNGSVVRIRNITVGCIWLLCFMLTGAMTMRNGFMVLNTCLLILSIVAISFCSLSVLYVLIRPGPGEQGRDRPRVDQSKQRAFCTIVVILGVMLLRCVWNLVWTTSCVSNQTTIDQCVGIQCEIWLTLPSTLVLPLLFLQRAGASACCKNILG